MKQKLFFVAHSTPALFILLAVKSLANISGPCYPTVSQHTSNNYQPDLDCGYNGARRWTLHVSRRL